MSITAEEVEHVARLAKLHFGPEEKNRVAEQLDLIVKYVKKLDELDTSGVKPTSHILDLTNVFREDELGSSLSPKEVLRNAPQRNDSYFSVPRVIQGP